MINCFVIIQVINVNTKLQKVIPKFYAANDDDENVDYDLINQDDLTNSHMLMNLSASFPVIFYLDFNSAESTLLDLEKKVYVLFF